MNLISTLAKRKGWLVASSSALAAALVIGCGGGGGGGGGNDGGNPAGPLQGASAQAAIGIADGQAAQVGTDIPFQLVMQLSPTPLAAKARAVNRALSVRGLTFLQPLGLYYSAAKTGTTFTMSFFTDAAGKTSAGSVKAVSSVSGSTTTYTVNGTVAGLVPLSITNLKLAFAGTTGANTMNGEIVITKADSLITLDLSLSLDSSFQVSLSDSIKVTYNYPTKLGIKIPTVTNLTNLVGGPLTNITGDAAISALVFSPTVPSTGTGTGTFTPSTGDFTLTLTDGALKGLAETFLGTGDTLSMQAVDGSTFNFTDVANQVITAIKTTTSTTGGTTSGNTAYAAPVPIPGSGSIQVGQALADGEMVGFSTSSTFKTTGLYWSSPTATPESLTPPTGGSATTAWGISNANNQQMVVGSYVNSAGVQQACYWTRATKNDIFAAHSTTPQSHGAEFRAISANGNMFVGGEFDASGIEHPIAYISGTLYPLPGDGRQKNLVATGVDNFKDVVGSGDFPNANPGVWIDVAVDQSSSTIKTPLTPLSNEGISNPNLTAGRISPTGRVVGGTGTQADYWDMDTTFFPHQMSLGTNLGGLAYGISDDGTKIVGAISPGNTTTPDLGLWSTIDGAPTDITKLMPANTYKGLAGFYILTNGSIIAISTNTSTGKTTFLYVKKN